MEALKLEEQSLRKAMEQRADDPYLIFLLEKIINFNKLTDVALIAIYYTYPDNDVIRSRLENMEDSLVAAIWDRADDPLLVRLLEKTIDFNKLTDLALIAIYYTYPDNDVIRSRLENMEDTLVAALGYRADDPLLVRLLEKTIDFNKLTEDTLELIYYSYDATTYTTIISKVTSASYRLWKRMMAI